MKETTAGPSAAYSRGTGPRAFAVLFLLCGIVVLAAGGRPARAKDFDARKAVEELKAGDPGTRARAAEDLGRNRSAEAADALTQGVKSEKDPAVRAHMADSLAATGDKRASAELKRLAREDKSADVRSMSCLSLGSLNDRTAVPVLAGTLGNLGEKTEVRLSAASALTFYLSEPQAAKALETALRGDNTILKFGIVNSLRHARRSEEGKRLLGIAAQDADEGVRNLSGELLGK